MQHSLSQRTLNQEPWLTGSRSGSPLAAERVPRGRPTGRLGKQQARIVRRIGCANTKRRTTMSFYSIWLRIRVYRMCTTLIQCCPFHAMQTGTVLNRFCLTSSCQRVLRGSAAVSIPSFMNSIPCNCRYFRLVPAKAYLEHFASDRSHMVPL